VAATRQAANGKLHDIAWRLAPPLYILCNRRGNWADCVAMHRIALDSARQLGSRQGEAWILNNLGTALGVLHDAEAIPLLEQSLAIREQIGDQPGQTQALNNLADAFEELGQRERAVVLLRRALDLNRELGNEYGEAVALTNLGDALLHLDQVPEAAQVLEEARALDAKMDHLRGGYALHCLGECYLLLDQLDKALNCLTQAVEIHRALGNRLQEAFTLGTLATAQSRHGLADQARDSRLAAVTILDELGDHDRAAKLRAEPDDMS